jgi:hypothetical protein
MGVDDTKQTQEELGLGSTDDPSSSSAEGKEVEAKESEAGKEVLTPGQQKERVEFGRRTAKRLDTIEQTIADRFSRTEETMTRLEQMLSERLAPPPPEERDESEEAEYQRHKKFRDREAREQITYEQGFRKTIDQIKEKDAVLHKEIFDEMFTNFNSKVSGNPGVDAELNYIKAKASLMAKKLSIAEKGRSNSGNRNLGPTGLSIGSRTGEQGEPDVVLSADAEAYAKARGLDPAFIKKAINEKS